MIRQFIAGLKCHLSQVGQKAHKFGESVFKTTEILLTGTLNLDAATLCPSVASR